LNSPATRRVLMVCMGNICRSPTAEAVLRHKLTEAGLTAAVVVDSAGTHGYHIGAPPDERAQAHARRRGYALDSLRARAVAPEDFLRFDLILAMDDENLRHLQRICPAEHRSRLALLSSHAPPGSRRDVPDPYYGREAGFEEVLDLVEAACDGLVTRLRSGSGTD
jgi:protein-tyrosine phosphatase